MLFKLNSRVSRWLLVSAAAVTFGAGFGACKKDEKAGDEKVTQPAPGAMVAVTAEGTKFDPPVTTAQIPDGAWMCDMGSVHFAASEKGAEGTCPICGMPLSQKGAKVEAAPETPPAAAATGDAGAGAEPAAAGANAEPAAAAMDAGAGAEGTPSDHAGHAH